MKVRQHVLDRIFTLDGLGAPDTSLFCHGCGSNLLSEKNTSIHRCISCIYSPLLCKNCLLRLHYCNPLHHIEVCGHYSTFESGFYSLSHKIWNGDHWIRDELITQGLEIRLGHHGNPCLTPMTRDMFIMDVGTFNHVRVVFCGCSAIYEERLEHNQLLSARLFPATFSSPKTAFTFLLLDHLISLSARGKTSTFDLYCAIRSQTDCCELEDWPVSLFLQSHVFRISLKCRNDMMNLAQRFGNIVMFYCIKGLVPDILQVVWMVPDLEI